jgi:cytidylate kinase
VTRRPIVAIDGPAGAGKSTVARGVASRLGFTYVDTGAMYRAAALRCVRGGIDPADAEACGEAAAAMRLEFAPGAAGVQRVLADGEDITDAIRTPEISALSSPVSKHPGVRLAMTGLQRKMGARGGVVMEGRDIGTVVYPDAEVKVFLTASAEERARRRAAERVAADVVADVTAILREINERDERDTTRAEAPLRQADDARLLVTDGLTPEQVIDAIVAWANEAGEGAQ